jgi:hypothetical protein
MEARFIDETVTYQRVAIPNGLGKHMIFIGPQKLVTTLKFLYIQLGAYHTCAGLVKLSLLCQYLRLFKAGTIRQICIVMFMVTCMWSVVLFIQGWFPCFPVSGFWDRLQQPPPKCWGVGFETIETAVVSLYALAASNMILDMIIFSIPIAVYLRPGANRGSVVPFLALFSLGAM